MWELLQKLEDLGWKPYGKSIAELTETEKNVRLLTSLSSGLWQFVCENGMIEHKGLDIHSWEHTTAEHSDFWFTDGDNYEYYIIEISLKDESELEQFLLDNIRVEGEV